MTSPVDTSTRDAFVVAIQEQRLHGHAAEVLDDPASAPAARALAERCRAACEAIGRRVAAERAAIVSVLAAAGIRLDDAANGDVPQPMQHHTIELRVADAATAARAASVLAAHGFDPWERWASGAERSFRHHAGVRTVVRSTDVTVVVAIRWADRRRRSALARAFAPTAADWHLVALPEALWWGYPIVRPLRLLAERIGLRARHASGLGPYLSTPEELVPGLLDAADVAADDLVVDLGCGDGRLVVRAALERGCRAIGVERDPDLAERARRSVRDAGLVGRVDIVTGDARSLDLGSATVALLFLPVDVAGDIVPDLIARLPLRARLVVHEQRPLPDGVSPPPDESMMVVGAAAVTVAHLWRVGPP